MSELPKQWAAATLEEACGPEAPIIYGILQPGPDTPGGVPYVRPTEIKASGILLDQIRRTTPEIASKYQRSTLKTGDLLLSIVGTIGKVAVIPQELDGGNITQSSCRIRPEHELFDPCFMAHFLHSPQATGQYGENRLGTAVPRLNLADVRKITAPLPPLPEQRRIVAKLDRLSARSTTARDHLARTTRLATRAKQAILTSALSGELTRSWRDAGFGHGWTDTQIAEIENHRASYAKSRRGSRLESDSGMKLQDLGKLPESWFPCHLAEIADMQVGHAFKSAWFTNEGPLLVRGANVSPGALSWEDAKHLDPELAHEFERFRLDEGDIVLAMDRPLISTGLKIARIDATSAGALLVQRVARITERSQAQLGYLWQVLNSRIFIRHAIERATGGDLPHISGNDILTTPVPLPPLDEQAEIVRRIEAAFAHIDRLTEEASLAAHLLDRLDERLLAKAFRGELVPQNPDDEPAEALLTRIRQARAAAPNPKRRHRKKATAE